MAKQVNRYGAYTDVQLEDPRIGARAIGTAALTQQLQTSVTEIAKQHALELEGLKKEREDVLKGYGVKRAQIKKVADEGHNYDYATLEFFENLTKDEMKDIEKKRKGELSMVDYALRYGQRQQWIDEIVLQSGTFQSNIATLDELLEEDRVIQDPKIRVKDMKFLIDMYENNASVEYPELNEALYKSGTLTLHGVDPQNTGAELDLTAAFQDMKDKGEMYFQGFGTNEEIAESVDAATEALLEDIDTVKEKHTAVEMQAKDDVTGELLFEADGKTPIMTTGRRDYAVQDEVAAREIWEAKGLSILDDVEKHELFRFLSRQNNKAGNPYIKGTYVYSNAVAEQELATAYIEYLVERGLKQRTKTNEQFNPIPTN